MAQGDHRAVEAAQNAVSSQLLETSINGATRVLVNVTSGNDLTLAEFHEAADQIAQLCDQRDANIIFGWVPDPSLEGEVRVTVLATGFGGLTTPEAPRANERGTQSSPYNRAPQQRPYPTVESGPAQHTPSPQPPSSQPVRASDNNQAPNAPEPRKASNDEIDIPAFLRRQR
jgi:cell division protein FtsZ